MKALLVRILAQLLPVERAKLILRQGAARLAPLGDEDGGIGDGFEDIGVAEIDDADQIGVGGQP